MKMRAIWTTAALLTCIAIASSANSEVIKPINNNSAVKVTLPLPVSEYYDFKLKLNGQPVTIGKEMPVDVPDCVAFDVEVLELGLKYQSKYCGKFVSGKTTEIQVPSVRLSGPTLKADTILKSVLYTYRFGDIVNTFMFGLNRESHLFALPKLIPYLSDATEIKVVMPMNQMSIAIDSTTKVFDFPNPSAQRPDITFQRVDAKVFPDVMPLSIRFFRASIGSNYISRTSDEHIAANVIDGQSFSFLKQPWKESDQFQLCQVSTGRCSRVYLIGGVDAKGVDIPSTYPTAIRIYRIDVDNVTVNSADGRVAVVPGKYSVLNQAQGSYLIIGAKTQTGIDVLPGEYEVVVGYDDPFTLKNEMKKFNLNFK